MTTCPTCGRRLSERNGAGSEPDTCSDTYHDIADRAAELKHALVLVQSLLRNVSRSVCLEDRKGKAWNMMRACAGQNPGYLPELDTALARALEPQ